MSNINNESLTVITGTVLEHSAGTSQVVNNGNSLTVWLFILLKIESGEVVRINDVVLDNNVLQQIRLDEEVTLYIYKTPRGIFSKARNFILGSKSDKGVGVMDGSGYGGVVFLKTAQSIFFALAACLITSIILVPSMGMGLGLFITAIVGLGVLVMGLLHVVTISNIGNFIKRLGRELTVSSDNYKGTVIRNI